MSLFVLTACSGGSTTGNLPAAGAIPRGGTLRVVDVPPATGPAGAPQAGLPNATMLDQVLSFDPGAMELFRCCVTRGLLSYTGQPTDKGGTALHPDLAKAMPEVSPDGLTWTFHLRSGIHYAPPFQQTEIVAADFIRTLVRATRVSPVPLGPFLSVIRGFDEFAAGKTSSIAGLETPDTHTLVVRLAQQAGDLGYRFALTQVPTPALPGDPSAPFGVATGHDDGYGAYLVASGPYMVEGSEQLDFSLPPKQQPPLSGLVLGKSITLVRNPSWSAATDGLRPAYVDRIVISYSSTIPEAADKVDRGEADLVLSNDLPPQAPLDQIRTYQNDPGHGRVELQPLDAVEYLTMNLAVPPFDDLRVRRAVAYTIDREAVVRAYGGPVNGTVTGHILLDSMEDNALLTFNPYRTKDSAARIAAARAEMARSPYDPDHDGICDVAACSHINAISRSNRPPATTDEITRDLADIGITIQARPLGIMDFFTQLADPASRTPIAFLWTTGSKDYPNGEDWFPSMFGSSAVGVGPDAISFNYSLVGATTDQLHRWGYSITSVPSVDDRIAQCVPLVGAAQTRCWPALDTYMVENVVPVVPLVSINHAQVVPSRVVRYSYDQSTDLPALDRIAIRH